MTSNPDNPTIEFTADFRRDLKSLYKKYRNVRADLDAFILRLKNGETPGDQVQGTGYTVYKARLKSRDLQRGKTGGYRVIYYIQTTDSLVLLTIYIKLAQVDISKTEIRRSLMNLKSLSLTPYPISTTVPMLLAIAFRTTIPAATAS